MIRIHKLLALLILILFISGIGMGIFVLTHRITPQSTNKQIANSSPQPTRILTPTPTPISDIRPYLYSVNIGPDSTEGAKLAYREKIFQLAVPSTTLVLDKCYPQPAILAVKKDSTLKLINHDNKEHTITINVDHHVKVSGKKEQMITVDFGKGLGRYEYYCDDSFEPRGIIVVK